MSLNLKQLSQRRSWNRADGWNIYGWSLTENLKNADRFQFQRSGSRVCDVSAELCLHQQASEHSTGEWVRTPGLPPGSRVLSQWTAFRGKIKTSTGEVLTPADTPDASFCTDAACFHIQASLQNKSIAGVCPITCPFRCDGPQTGPRSLYTP